MSKSLKKSNEYSFENSFSVSFLNLSLIDLTEPLEISLTIFLLKLSPLPSLYTLLSIIDVLSSK